MSRKAQALPLNTVVIAILVVLVLLVIGAFFLGGTSGIAKQIRSIFYGSTAGQDMVFAVQTCNQRCDALKLLPPASIPTSAYCTQSFFIDSDNNGEADLINPSEPKSGYKPWYCYEKIGQLSVGNLGVPCRLDDGTVAATLCK